MNSKRSGFTLIELLIVIAIVGIVTAVALPSYLNQSQKANRTAAKNALLDLAAREESYFAINNAYTNQLSNLGYTLITNNTLAIPSSSQNYYTVSITSVGSSTPSYVLQAAPVTGSPQANDACQIYQLDNYGNKSNVTSTGATVTTSNCW